LVRQQADWIFFFLFLFLKLTMEIKPPKHAAIAVNSVLYYQYPMGYFLGKEKIIIGLILVFLVWRFVHMDKTPESLFGVEGAEKKITVNINGLNYGTMKTKTSSVKDLLAEQKITLGEKDRVAPSTESKIYSGSKIFITQARKVFILDKDKTTDGFVLGLTVTEALKENNIAMGEDDLIVPAFSALARDGEKITITRVEIREEKDLNKIDFKKVSQEDDKLGWRVKKISQAGKLGKKELTFKAVYHNSKLISRKLLGEKVLEEPTEEISVQGTFMKLGKAKTGQASHYAASWGNLNASRDILRGGFVKVTNLENGKSVVVKINDYGPIAKERIIDLNRASFVEIANAWQGIIHRIKVEQVLN